MAGLRQEQPVELEAKAGRSCAGSQQEGLDLSRDGPAVCEHVVQELWQHRLERDGVEAKELIELRTRDGAPHPRLIPQHLNRRMDGIPPPLRRVREPRCGHVSEEPIECLQSPRAALGTTDLHGNEMAFWFRHRVQIASARDVVDRHI